MRQVDVVTVGVDQASGAPLLLLREIAGQRRLLPIWIGEPEATAIAVEHTRASPARPMAHQLLGQIVESFGRRLREVRIIALRQGQFHAELIFDRQVRVPARASDAVALALHLGVAIHAEDAILNDLGLTSAQIRGGKLADQDEAESPATGEEIDKFRRFLDTVSPEDFDTT